MKIRFLIFITIISSVFLHPNARAQESPAEEPEQSPSSAENTPISAESKTQAEGLRLAGFPVRLLKYEPALAAAFQLTPEQAQNLKTAWAETVDQTKKGLADNSDTAQVKQMMKRAQKDFASRKDAILSEEQMSMLTTIMGAYASSREQAKTNKAGATMPDGGIKEIFLAKIKASLNADQLARIAAAGGKMP